jgi:hypothetical protein
MRKINGFVAVNKRRYGSENLGKSLGGGDPILGWIISQYKPTVW